MEVQISNNSLHLLYLQKTVNQTAVAAGLDRKETDDITKAVNEICQSGIIPDSKEENRLSVNIDIYPGCFTAEIRSCNNSSGILLHERDLHQSANLKHCAERYVDKMELIRDPDMYIIRLIKYAGGSLVKTNSIRQAPSLVASSVGP